MVIQIRGNNGSGKSYLVRMFMEEFDAKPYKKEDKIIGYTFKIGKQPWFVVGKYITQCGGLDTISPVQAIVDRIQWAVDKGYHVICEGILVSDNYGLLGTYSNSFNNDWIFTLLQTPVDECIRRIQERRKAAGNPKPFDPHRTLIPRQRAIERVNEKIINAGRHVVLLPTSDEASYKTLLKLARSAK